MRHSRRIMACSQETPSDRLVLPRGAPLERADIPRAVFSPFSCCFFFFVFSRQIIERPETRGRLPAAVTSDGTNYETRRVVCKTSSNARQSFKQQFFGSLTRTLAHVTRLSRVHPCASFPRIPHILSPIFSHVLLFFPFFFFLSRSLLRFSRPYA